MSNERRLQLRKREGQRTGKGVLVLAAHWTITNTNATYISLDFTHHCGAIAVNDRIDLFDQIEIGFVIGVLHTHATPGNVRQLIGW